jgi:hypothetical protein
MKTWLVALMLIVSVCHAAEPTPTEKAIQTLVEADDLLKANHPTDAARKDLEIFKVKGLPAEVYSAALLLMGNISLTTGNLDVAEVAYKQVLLLAKAPDDDKKAARTGILLVGDLRKDAAQLSQHQTYK